MENEQENETFEVRDLREKSFYWIDNDFFNGYAKILGPNALAIYCSLARHADRNQKCFPSQKKIAEELSLSETTVREYIKVLEYFKIIKKQRIGKQCTNRYWLLSKKYWRKDFNIILKELSEHKLIMDSEHKELLFTPLAAIVHTISSLCSNSNNIQKKQNTKETIINAKALISTNSPLEENSKEKKELTNGAAENLIIGYFKNINPSYEILYSRKVQRLAIQRLLKKFGEEKLIQIIKIIERTNGLSYAPIITTPILLEENLGKLGAFLRREKNEKEKEINNGGQFIDLKK